MKPNVQYSPLLHIAPELQSVPSDDVPWLNLRNAVIERAADDYMRIACCKRQNHIELRKIEKFFLDGYCDFLLNGAELTGAAILDRLRERASEERKKRGIVDKGDEE